MKRYPFQSNFRVGAKPRATGLYESVHEDCELGAGNTPENSSGTGITVALVGNPNTGKSSLFNCLTHSQQSVGNWSGVTIEKKVWTFIYSNVKFQVVDLPGLYTLNSLVAHTSRDERIPYDFLVTEPYDIILNIVDASHLERNLYLTLQLLELGKPVILALNMMDVLNKQKDILDLPQLSALLGCPVVSLTTTKRKGLDALKDLLLAQTEHVYHASHFQYHSELVEAALSTLTAAVQSAQWQSQITERAVAFHLLESGTEECYLTPPLKQAVLQCAKNIEQQIGYEADIAIAKVRYDLIEAILSKTLKASVDHHHWHWTPRIDTLVLDRFLGVPVFLGVMYALFMFSIQVGGLFEAFMDTLSHGFLVEGSRALLEQWGSPLWMIAIVSNGLGEGLSTILTFMPVIVAMFWFLTLLEDSGYMARAAFVVDRIMQQLGLPGKSFVPMIIGFGCNVPAIMAARTLERERDRILTVMMSPFMSCGARLAIYTLFVAAFFPHNGQNIIFALYLIGILMAIMTGWFLKKTLLMGEPSPLVMELPPYRWPRWGSVFYQAGLKAKRFALNAGKLIVPVCLLIGALNTIPFQGNQTVLSTMGRAITPLFHPMGITQDNWPATVGLLTGIMAKEVVVGTLNALYAQQLAIEAPIHLHSFDGASIITNAWHTFGDIPPNNSRVVDWMISQFDGQVGAFAYLLFVLLYFPCISATSAITKEISIRWSIFSMVWTTGLAYGLAVLFYQIFQLPKTPGNALFWITSVLFGFGVGLKSIFTLVPKPAKPLPTRIVMG